MKQRPQQIGEVECPQKGCTRVCPVYGFEARTPGRRSVFTGKKYLVCETHGRIGADGSQAITDYILENGKIWGANRPEPKPEKPAENPAPPAAAATPKTPEPKPAPTPQPPRRNPPRSKPAPRPAKPGTAVAEKPVAPTADRGWKPLID